MSDDAVLMNQIADGDRDAFGVIYERYSGLAYALCLRMLRDRAAADELLADVFMEVWRRADRYDATRGSFATYLTTLCRSRGIDRLRAKRARAAVALPEDDALSALMKGESTDPGSGIITGERRQQVQSALSELGPDLRAAVELAFYEGLSHTQVAERLGKPLGTVKTHIRQGLIQLRDRLRNVGNGDA